LFNKGWIMLLRKWIGGTLFAVLLAVPISAQDLSLPQPAEEESAPSVEEGAPVAEAAPVAEVVAPAPSTTPAETPKAAAVVNEEATGERSAMNTLRGNAYGASAMGNIASAMTVNRSMSWPHNYANLNVAYIEPVNRGGMASFGVGSVNAILALYDVDGSNGLTTVGLASKGWGLLLQLGLEKDWTTISQEGVPDNKESYTRAGDLLRLFASFQLGTLQLAVNGAWLTTADERYADNGVMERVEDFYDLAGGIALTNYVSGAGNLQWEVSLDVGRHELVFDVKTPAGKVTVGDPDAFFGILLSGKVGSKALAKEDARLLVGLNTDIWTTLFDTITDEVKEHYDFGVSLAPNLVGEVALGKYWIAYAGLTHEITFERQNINDLNNTAATADDVTTATTTLITTNTQAASGLRFATTRFALEAGLANNIYTDGTSVLFDATNGAGLMANFGAMLFF